MFSIENDGVRCYTVFAGAWSFVLHTSDLIVPGYVNCYVEKPFLLLKSPLHLIFFYYFHFAIVLWHFMWLWLLSLLNNPLIITCHNTAYEHIIIHQLSFPFSKCKFNTPELKHNFLPLWIGIFTRYWIFYFFFLLWVHEPKIIRIIADTD